MTPRPIDPDLGGSDAGVRPREGLVCPVCGHHGSVIVESRATGRAVRRRRRCGSCGHRFTSYETVATAEEIAERHRRALVGGVTLTRDELAGLRSLVAKLLAADGALKEDGA